MKFLALLLLVSQGGGHRASIQILAAEQGDANPRKLQAAIDVGAFAFSVLITWTEKLAR